MRPELDERGGVSDGRRTVRDAVADYGLVLAEADRKRSTVSSHEWMLRLVDEGLGWQRLAELSVDDCDTFLRHVSNGMRPGARPVGPDHLARVRAMLVAVIRNEVRVGTLGRNVAELSNRPKRAHRGKSRSSRRALSRVELRRLLDAASGSTLVTLDLIGRNGLRPAEARALTWAALDGDKHLLTVKAQMDEEDDLGHVKTEESLRTIRIDDRTTERLTDWRTTQAELRERHSERWTDLDLVVTTRFGTPVNRNNLLRAVRRLCERAEIRPAIVPYDLRHTAISHQADAGRSSWEIGVS